MFGCRFGGQLCFLDAAPERAEAIYELRDFHQFAARKPADFIRHNSPSRVVQEDRKRLSQFGRLEHRRYGWFGQFHWGRSR